jgi:hypothetical protein
VSVKPKSPFNCGTISVLMENAIDVAMRAKQLAMNNFRWFIGLSLSLLI